MAHKIFVVGSSRSGTTMMARILREAPEAWDLRELHFFEQMVTGEEFLSDDLLSEDDTSALVKRLLSVVKGRYLLADKVEVSREEIAEVLDGASRMTRAEIYDRFTQHIASINNASCPIDQTPRNIFYVDEILTKFPEARFVSMVRDARDVVLSQKNKWKGRRLGVSGPVRDKRTGKMKDVPISRFEAFRSWANYHPFIISKLWRQAANEAKRIRDRSEVISIRYEDLLADPEGVVRRAAEHCGLTFVPEMLQIDADGSSHAAQTQKGIDPDRVGRWRGKLSDEEVAICEDAVKPLLEEWGYAESQLRGSAAGRAFWWSVAPFKLGLALSLNLGRIRNLSAWASKRFATR